MVVDDVTEEVGPVMLLEMTMREVAATVHEMIEGVPGACDRCLAVTEAVLGVLTDDPRGLVALAVGSGALIQETPLLYRRAV